MAVEALMTLISPTRRKLLQSIGALAVGGSGLSANLFAREAQSDLSLVTKPIPSSGEEIPVVGLGTNQFSVETPDEMAGLQQVLQTMADMGGTVVDTARAYGRAEEVIGELLQVMGNREQYFISTKTSIRGDLLPPDEEIQASFDRLQVDIIDLLLIHNLYGTDELLPAFIAARESGRVRYIGMSTSVDAQYETQMEGMRRYPLDFIQVDYSIANRSAEEAILPLAQELGMAVQVNVPFGGRGRAATTTFGKVAGMDLPDWAAEIDVTSWAQFFLKYVVSHPAVTCAIPGTTKVSHLVDNQKAGRGRLPDAAMRKEMERLWDSL